MPNTSININTPTGAFQQAAASPLLLPYTYTSANNGVAVAAAATDVFTLENPVGSGQVIRVTAASTSGFATTAITINILLVKRSSLNSGGTSTSPASVPHDSQNPAAVGIIRSYTANPAALGTAVGTARAVALPIALSGTVGSASTYLLFDTEGKAIQPYTLRPGELLAINFGGGTITTPNFDFFMEWTESVV